MQDADLTPEAVLIGHDYVDWQRFIDGTIVLSGVYPGAARRIFRRAYWKLVEASSDTTPLMTYAVFNRALEKFLPK